MNKYVIVEHCFESGTKEVVSFIKNETEFHSYIANLCIEKGYSEYELFICEDDDTSKCDFAIKNGAPNIYLVYKDNTYFLTEKYYVETHKKGNKTKENKLDTLYKWTILPCNIKCSCKKGTNDNTWDNLSWNKKDDIGNKYCFDGFDSFTQFKKDDIDNKYCFDGFDSFTQFKKDNIGDIDNKYSWDILETNDIFYHPSPTFTDIFN